MNRYAEITGWGKCLPPARLSNQDITTFLDTSDKWIVSRTGIEERRISHVNTSDLATVAAQRAIACAGLLNQEIDLVIVATCSADTLIPNVASKVCQNLGLSAAAFDLNAACTGFVYALETATRLLQAGAYHHAVVIGAERLSFFIDWTERDTAVLFGDGAGAVVLSHSVHECGLLQSHLGCDAGGRDILSVPSFGTGMDRFAADNGFWEFNFVGKEIFKRAVKGMGAAMNEILSREGLALDQIDQLIPHQANLRIIQTLCDLAQLPLEKAFVNISQYGNTSAATVPIALCEAVEQGRVEPNANLVLTAFGAGLTWGAGLVRWGNRVTPIANSDASLPECQATALELIQSTLTACKANKERENNVQE